MNANERYDAALKISNQRVKQAGWHAFPSEGQDGMTLLDYFAGQALNSLLSAKGDCDLEVVAQAAYSIAEEMIKESDRRYRLPLPTP